MNKTRTWPLVATFLAVGIALSVGCYFYGHRTRAEASLTP